jgi:hypothetical protein
MFAINGNALWGQGTSDTTLTSDSTVAPAEKMSNDPLSIARLVQIGGAR